MTTAPTDIVAVVPAHNEQDGIAVCLAGLLTAAAHCQLAGVRVKLVVVLDACDDLTRRRAAEALATLAPIDRVGGTPATSGSRIRTVGNVTGRLITVAVRNVGRARALGAAAGLDALAAVNPEGIWLATTDADSVVPPNWLAHQLQLRRAGADGCAGMVVVDSWLGHPPGTRAAYEQRYWPRGRMDFAHRHVHGTNLGVSMAAYLDAGGFPAIATGEDHALWEALRAADRRLVATPLAAVTTSGRRHGRSPAGFAEHLTSLDCSPA